jgi:predicted alpha/beta-hydrolase family hydrolase
MTAPPALHFDGPGDAPLTLALAHGAGAPMDTPFMAAFAEGLAAAGLRVARFEFPYMAASRRDGRKRPPDRQPVLLESWRQVIRALGPERLAIGGKSLGGRMASLIADETAVRGLVCLGYPFHPPGRPERLRTAHLETIVTPTLIVQGTRDPFGAPAEVAGYRLSPAVRLYWAEDGDHGLTPRKASGRTAEQNWSEAAAAIAAFLGAPGAKP